MAKDSSPSADDCDEISSSCVSHNLRRASRAMTQLFDAHFDEIGLKATQYTVLSALASAEGKPLPIGELAEILVLDQSSLSRNLAVLERLALIALEPSRVDRRERIVNLTKEGRVMLARGFPIWKKVQGIVQDALKDGLEAQLEALRTLTRTAQELRPTKSRRPKPLT